MAYSYSTAGGYEAYYARYPQHLPTLLRCYAALGSSPWEFLDVGGGTGLVSDFILARFPQSSGIVLDASQQAISANVPQPRKKCICASVEHMRDYFQPGKFRLILMHDFLHHVVTGRYGSSIRAVDAVLQQAAALLRPGGHLSILEQCYDGWIDNLPGHLIFTATSNRALARMVKLAGSHAAGVGVCFRSARQWRKVLQRNGWAVESETATIVCPRRWLINLALGLKARRYVHFWCR